jgi:hypothetical protein
LCFVALFVVWLLLWSLECQCALVSYWGRDVSVVILYVTGPLGPEVLVDGGLMVFASVPSLFAVANLRVWVVVVPSWVGPMFAWNVSLLISFVTPLHHLLGEAIIVSV